MPLRLGNTAPNFTANTTVGEIDFHKYLGDSWGVLFSHPADFTPVCTTELAEVAKLQGEFAKRNTKTLAYSCDSVEDHIKWSKDIESYAADSGCDAKVTFPIIEGTDRKVAELYGMVDEMDETNKNKAGMPMTVRSVFFIAPNKQIKCIITYPASTGRNFNEVLRIIDSLQMAPAQGLATPVNWQKGDKACVLPFVKTADAEAKFGKDNIEHRFSYLRLTKPLEE